MRAAISILLLSAAAARADSPYEGLCGHAIHEIVAGDERPPLPPDREVARALGEERLALRRHLTYTGSAPRDFRYRPRTRARCWRLAIVAAPAGSVEVTLGAREKISVAGPRAAVVADCTDNPARPEIVVHVERAAEWTFALAAGE